MHAFMAPFAVFLFSVFLLHHHRVTAEFSVEEKQALIWFRGNVTLKTDYQTSWDKKDVCDWKGVECNTARTSVIRLRIPGAVVGKIPPETIGKLVSLRVISLRLNNLSGPVPKDFSDLVELTHLFLYNNSLSGQLPEMKKVRKLNVSNNHFSGIIPPSLSQFPKSAFSGNINLCGGPLPPCKQGTPSPPPPPPQKNPKKESIDKRVIVGISVASSLLLLILLCCLRKKINNKSKRQRSSKLPVQTSASASKASTSTEIERNKLVFFESGIYSFDLEDLYRASPEVLGKGSLGTSYKEVVGGKTVVVKRLKDAVVSKDKFESTMKALGEMKNDHLVPLIAYYYSKHERLIVYDYVPAGSLFAHLHGSRGFGQTRLDWDHRMRIALSAARGVAYLHVGKVVHGNIKSSNILLRQENNKDAYVSDYGLNTLFDKLSFLNHQVTGYRAPEVIKTREVTFESDVYSFGVLLLELLTGKNPNQASLRKEGFDFLMWVQSVVHKEPKAEVFDVELKRHQNIEEEMTQLLQIAKDCVLFEPDQRPTMHKVVRMMEDINRVVTNDHWLIQSSDDHSKAFDDTPSTETRDTPSTITP